MMLLQLRRLCVLALLCVSLASAWMAPAKFASLSYRSATAFVLQSSSSSSAEETAAAAPSVEQEEEEWDYEVPEDAVVVIKPAAMSRLRELRQQQNRKKSDADDDDAPLVLRMGVRSGGCSGMSYVMDIVDDSTAMAAIQDDDAVDDYEKDKIQCVVDAKSMLYLYGMELDYSTELIGGGFRFYNPNAEESCGCGSSFAV